jgi:azurin
VIVSAPWFAPKAGDRRVEAQSTAVDARTIQITARQDMKFSVTTLAAAPGERIRIVLAAAGNMPRFLMAHNWILLRKDTDVEAFINAGLAAEQTDFIAPDQRRNVIASTPLIVGGQTAEVTFTAPVARGEYPYVCSFRGHAFAGMRGSLTVE